MVSIASMAGERGSRDMPMVGHSAAKGGVIGFMRQVAAEGAPHGIRAVTISRADRHADDRSQDRRRPGATAGHRRPHADAPLGEPENIADTAAFLASHRAEFITGINVPVDGGMSAF